MNGKIGENKLWCKKIGIHYRHFVWKKVAFLEYVKEDEWDIVLQIFSAVCKIYGESPTEMLRENIPVENLLTDREDKYVWLDAM